MADLLQERITSLEQRLKKEPKSPLFARLGGYYLQVGRAEDALRICDEGLANYPFYTTAHLVKGKALLELRMMAEARREFEVVHEFLPSSETIARLVSSIDLGPSADLSAPGIEEPTPSASSVAVYEEPAQPEAPSVEEPMPQMEESQPMQMETPMIEEAPSPFSAEETTYSTEAPALETQEQPQAESLDVRATVSFETAPTDEALQESAPVSSYDEADPLAALRGEGSDTYEAVMETPVQETPSETPADEVSNYFDAFSQLEQAAPVSSEPAATEPPVEENPFAAFGMQEETTAASGASGTEEESFEQFAARMRMELIGTEETMTMEEYLATASSNTLTGTNHIEEIAEKLKTPKKITPVINFSEKAARTASEAGTPAETGFVTPTLAEIYAKQGWYDDAIKAYRTLASTKPAEREKFEERIKELEALKKSQQG